MYLVLGILLWNFVPTINCFISAAVKTFVLLSSFTLMTTCLLLSLLNFCLQYVTKSFNEKPPISFVMIVNLLTLSFFRILTVTLSSSNTVSSTNGFISISFLSPSVISLYGIIFSNSSFLSYFFITVLKWSCIICSLVNGSEFSDLTINWWNCPS